MFLQVVTLTILSTLGRESKKGEINKQNKKRRRNS